MANTQANDAVLVMGYLSRYVAENSIDAVRELSIVPRSVVDLIDAPGTVDELVISVKHTGEKRPLPFGCQVQSPGNGSSVSIFYEKI